MDGKTAGGGSAKEIKAALLSKVARHYTGEPVSGLLTLFVAGALFLPYYLAAAMLALYCVYILCNPARRAVIARFSRYRLIYVMCGIAEIAAAVYGNWLGMLTAPVVALVLTAFLYAARIMDRWLHEMIVEIACAGSLFAFVVAAAQYLWMHYLNPIYINKMYRPDSMFSNANYYAAIIEFVCLLCVYRLLRSRRNWLYYVAVLAANLIALELSGCRSAYPAILAGAVLLLFFARRIKLGVAVTAAGAALAGMSVALSLFLPKFPEILPRLSSLLSAVTIRAGIWWAALQNIFTHPLFGEGPLTFTNIYHQYGSKFEWHSHDIFLEMLLSYGVVGAVLAGMILGRFYKDNIRPARAARDVLFLGLLAGVTAAIVVHGVTDCTIYWYQTGGLAALLLAYPKRQAEVPEPRAKKVKT